MSIKKKHQFNIAMDIAQPDTEQLKRIFSIIHGFGTYGFKDAAKMIVEEYFAEEEAAQSEVKNEL